MPFKSWTPGCPAAGFPPSVISPLTGKVTSPVVLGGTVISASNFVPVIFHAQASLPWRVSMEADARVMVPVVLPAVLASAVLVFTLVAGNFATSMILGHQVDLLSVLTYQATVSETGSNPVLQSALATTSIAVVMIALFVQRWIVARGRYEMVQGRTAPVTPLRGLRGETGGGLTRDYSGVEVISAWRHLPVLDWGIATKPGPCAQLAGTPAYMAPEMLGAPQAVISERTDVYLLGSILFEVLVPFRTK